MVRYVFNCWRDGKEVLLVRRQFFDEHEQPSLLPSTPTRVGDGLAGGAASEHQGGRDATAETRRRQRRLRQQKAVARVSMWMSRQHCPHLVESTALLTAAILGDDEAAATGTSNAWSTYAVRATYAAAFSRFVTGLLDGHQDKQRKQSMYAVAKKIGLPATFVELRHQSTHEHLPSRAKLRSMAKKALSWIRQYYWDNAVDDPKPGVQQCREAILAYLRGNDEDARRSETLQELSRWDADLVLATITELQGTLPGNQVFLKCLKLSKDVALARARTAASGSPAETSVDEPCRTAEDAHMEAVSADLQESIDQASPPTSGWVFPPEGCRRFRPIGDV
ncbi:hypothetical protein HIM_00407 [Hirsutella minnesotensis 3608]|nr:hypothetical protein HIM_00407 [Hirsutella minnesotensis 3608]